MNYRDSIQNYFLNFLIALIILSLGSLLINQLVHLKDEIAIISLKEKPTTDFFNIYSITPIRPSFPVGTYPSFWLDSIYYLQGPVEGSNVLICDNYRSDAFVASGFIAEEQVNSRPAFPNALTVNSDLPDSPTTCFLRSTITFCTATYPEVCKSRSVDSEGFNFK